MTAHATSPTVDGRPTMYEGVLIIANRPKYQNFVAHEQILRGRDRESVPPSPEKSQKYRVS